MNASWRLRAALLVSLAAIVPYARTIDNYFVQDDFGVVWLLSQKPWTYFPRWFASTWMDDIWGYTPDEIRPFPAVTYQAAAVFGAASPAANHAINIAFHAANGVLVLAVARAAAGLSAGASLVAALVFVLLPFQSESVAWITGRVDSMPACFYLSSFLLYVRWRGAPERARLYGGAVAMFIVALFTKQNAITLGPAIVLYDLAGIRRPESGIRGPVSRRVLPYVPFVVLTLGYFALRYALFGEVARESQLTPANIGYFQELVVRHLRRTVFGDVRFGSPRQWGIVAGAVAVVVACAVRQGREHAAWAARVAVYFGPIWWALGVAPVIVAGYESPRHIYLAAVGWAVIVGLAFHLLPRARPAWRAVSVAAAAAVIVFYGMQLVRSVHEWEVRSRVSERAVRDLEAEALRARAGTLIIAGAPIRSWEWAMPFITRAPFVDPAVERRVTVVTPWRLHCCRSDWDARTRATLRDWLARGGGPIVVLRWDAESGTRFRLTTEEEPYLRPLLDVLLDTDSYVSLDRGILTLLDRVPRDASQ